MILKYYKETRNYWLGLKHNNETYPDEYVQTILQRPPTKIVVNRSDINKDDKNEPVFKALKDKLKKGAYVVAGVAPKDADIILIGSGSEVQLAVKAVEQLFENEENGCLFGHFRNFLRK